MRDARPSKRLIGRRPAKVKPIKSSRGRSGGVGGGAWGGVLTIVTTAPFGRARAHLPVWPLQAVKEHSAISLPLTQLTENMKDAEAKLLFCFSLSEQSGDAPSLPVSVKGLLALARSLALRFFFFFFLSPQVKPAAQTTHSKSTD